MTDGLHRARGAWLGLVGLAACSGPSTTTGTGGAMTSSVTSTTVASSSSTAASTSASSGTGGSMPAAPPTKMDILLAVDNSRSMADKQQILALAIPDLLNGLLNPACVDPSGVPVPAAMQPPPTGSCPAGTTRDFPPILDVHIGLVSSSLGSFGADACPDTTTSACPGGAVSTSNNDHGHLVTRADPCASSVVPTYQNKGFLAWDPAMKLTPPGEAQLGDGTMAGLTQSLQNLVRGDGQIGCGFESQDESWYRFLVDPTPYQSIALNGQTVQTTGIDQPLLQQRQEFLRPDSLLLILELSDETDTSLKETSFYPLFAQEISNNQPFHLPTARQECATNGPNDPCCASCGQTPPPGCPTDPQCTSNPTYTNATENIALRAYGLTSHKARYGIEFFYQPSRYVSGLKDPMVPNSMGMKVPNPIFAGGMRPANWVFFGTITGVPWQLVARQKNGVPDLVNGESALDPKAVGGFKSGAELALTDAQGSTFWDDIVGDPEHYVAPKSPFMKESTTPRSGTDPITQIAVSPPTSPNGTNPINGHEWNIPTPAGDIQYACTFPLATPIDCSKPGTICDCAASATSNPLCDPNPNDNGNPTLQTRAKAYPGLKELAIAEGLGDQGIVASICASQITDSSKADYAYRPAAKSVIDALKKTLRGK